MTHAESELHDFIFRYSSDGILILNAQGVVEACNPAFVSMLKLGDFRITGVAAQSLFEDHPSLLRLLIADEDRSALVSLFDQQRLRLTITTFDDGRRTVLFQTTAEQSALATLRSKFAAVVAHDLRNPVAVLIGFSSLIEGSGQLDEEYLQYLSRIQDTSTKLHYAAADLVELAWIEAGMPLENKVQDFATLVSAAAMPLAKLADEQGIIILASAQEGLPPITTDADLLTSALRKLLHNAIYYSDGGRSISVHIWSEESSICYAITDEGMGIAVSELDNVFDRFYRSTDPRVRALPGGGIGLTLVRKFARHYGGEIRVTSQPDHGSTFTLRLPFSS